MTDTSVGNAPSAASRPSQPIPVRRWVLIGLGICAVLFVYHLVADRLTPYTSQAYVQAFVVDMGPEVSGTVMEVGVADNSDVKAGQMLFRIDPTRYELAVAAAEAALAQAGQTIGASTQQIASAQAKLSVAQANLGKVRQQSARMLELVRRGVSARARGDEARAELDAATAEVERARADLEAAKQQLGPQGAGNPQIRAAAAELERGRLDLVRASVSAPASGVVTNLKLSVGQFVAAGTPVMTFLDARAIWLVAELRERSLGHIQPGDTAGVVLDGLPGQVFAARVESIGWGISLGAGRDTAGLPTIGEEAGWLRGPQRFPVRLTFTEELPPDSVRVGSLGSVVVYTGDHLLLNALASVRLRLASWLGYVV